MAELDWIEKEVARVAALARSAPKEEIGPRALSARYDRKHQRIVVELNNGSTFAFPARKVQGLEDVPAAALGDIELQGGGYGLHWPRPNVSLRVEGALAGIFGSRKWMERLAASEGNNRGPARKTKHAAA
jgi:hypothetical protein